LDILIAVNKISHLRVKLKT